MNPIRLGVRQWVVLVAVLLALPVILSFAFVNEVGDFYLEYTQLPMLERDFGFRMKRVTVGENTSKCRCAFRALVVDRVEPGGAFASAGVLPGYMPFAVDNSFAVFCEQLKRSEKGDPVTLLFVPTRPIMSGQTVRIALEPRRLSNSALERTSTRHAGTLSCTSIERAEAAQLGTLGGR